MKQFVLDHLTHHLQGSDRVSCLQRECDGHDLLISLTDGTSVSVCVINRALRLTEVRERYAANTRSRIHSLFIIDGRMMPADKDTVTPPAWMSALHTLTLGRIYGYWLEGRAVTIRPIHMEWKWGGSPRLVEYGEAVAVERVRGERMSAGTKEIEGDFAVAYFGDTPFWKQQSDAESARFDYSWRNWSFGGARRESAREEREHQWDSWEEFQRAYGGESEPRHDDTGWTGDRSKKTHQPAARKTAVSAHYALLGVPQTATLDEVKQAYRNMARKFHPDLHPSEKEKYTAKMADINTAFEAILRAHD
jgi:DnaJ-domain-containing protein 1